MWLPRGCYYPRDLGQSMNEIGFWAGLCHRERNLGRTESDRGSPTGWTAFY